MPRLLALLPLLPALALAAPGPSDPALARIAPDLRAAALGPVRDAAWTQIVVEAAGDVDADVLAARVAAAGGRVERVARGRIQARVDGEGLSAVASLDGVARVRRPHRARSKAFTEGYAEMFEVDWQEAGARGQGVDIAVLDVGFTGYADLIGAELPDPLYAEFVGGGESTEHGTGVAEIIHDIAPRATLTLYDFETDVEFFAQLDAIAAHGPDLVNASIGFDNIWHADDTSPYTEAVNDLVGQGITWVAAAGNEDDSYWVGTLTDEDEDGVMEFEALGEGLVAFADGDGDIGVSLRWDEPFGGSGRDLDLEVTGCGGSDAEQDGDDDPYEEVVCAAGAAPEVRVIDYSGLGTPIRAWVYLFYGEWDEDVPTRRSTLTLPADASGAITVGAYSLDYEDLTSYSSTGPTDDGRLKPDITAPTDVSTEAYGPGGFNGTSAAAPHVTGALALAISADIPAEPEALRQWLYGFAVDMGPSGHDNWWGRGLLVVDEAPDTGFDTAGEERAVACGCATASPAAGVWVVLLGALAARRRRRSGA